MTWDGYLEGFHAARSAGAGPLLRASASAIPLRDASIDVVVCSMSLMVITPLPPVIAEITRVLRPGGLLAATIPAAGPLRPPDLAVVAGLIAVLGRAPGYPAGRGLPRIPALLPGCGLRVTADTRRRFGYRLRGAADAGQLLSSLYLPGISGARARLARGYLRFLARLGYEMPVPLRRFTAERAESRDPTRSPRAVEAAGGSSRRRADSATAATVSAASSGPEIRGTA